MSIDELGRAAAAEARRAAANGVNAMSMLEELRRRSRLRTMGAIGLAVAVCAAVVFSVLLARSAKPSAVGPAHTGPTSPSTPSTTSPPMRVGLPLPVTIHAPANFREHTNQFGTSCVEAYRKDVNGTGVTVMENARPERYDNSGSRDPSAGVDAESMAQWLSSRPFLTHTSVKQVYIDGIGSGWRVTGDLKSGARLPAEKSGTGPVAPTFADDGCTAGYGRELYGSYTLYDRGPGVTVIWSWTNEKNHALIAGNHAFIDGLRFG